MLKAITIPVSATREVSYSGQKGALIMPAAPFRIAYKLVYYSIN
jgi:hypothetical protein